MSESRNDFIGLCLAGEANISEIDDFVERWHTGDDPRELHEFLGMTEKEYAAWVARPESIRNILLYRRQSKAS